MTVSRKSEATTVVANDLTTEKKSFLQADGHILALGGPGSGKTFIALTKAGLELQSETLLPGQRILFLSFARASIARVAQQAKTSVAAAHRDRLETNTYHGFTWSILRSHGYLLRKGGHIRLLPPPEAAARLAGIDVGERDREMRRFFQDEGLLHFDLFAPLAGELLQKSTALTAIICDAYPTIILDEFQDTNAAEWKLIQTLGIKSRLIALADPDQRIYEFRGADPRRIREFIEAFHPTQYDFALENHRSNGTDITSFGNDLLSGANKGKTYSDVVIKKYQVRRGIALHLDLKCEVLNSCKRLHKPGKTGWSLAVLVPTKLLMLGVSSFLSEEQNFSNNNILPGIPHEVAIETAGPALAAVLVAKVLAGAATEGDTARQMLRDICAHVRGRKGSDRAPKNDLELAAAITEYLQTDGVRGKRRKQVIEECQHIARERHAMKLSGDPSQDWLSVRKLFDSATSEAIRNLSQDAKYIRLLHKGALLSSGLSELWRKNLNYDGAEALVRGALLQEHFSVSAKTYSGIHVMTVHKSKGKEFDEVIVYEGPYQGRIIRPGASDKDVAQARLSLRVAVTRAMHRTTILTPSHDVCVFL